MRRMAQQKSRHSQKEAERRKESPYLPPLSILVHGVLEPGNRSNNFYGG